MQRGFRRRQACPGPDQEFAPRNARAVSVEHGFDETAIIAGGDTGVTGFPETQVLDTLH